MEEEGALDPWAIVPLVAVDVLNSTINTRADTHVLYASYIYRLNIMFRHMPVPRDTSVLRQIIIVCCESAGKLPHSVQRRTFATCE